MGMGRPAYGIVDGILWHYGLRETPPDAFSV